MPQVYSTFVNGFSYTVATSTLNRITDMSGGADLLVLAAALGLAVILITMVIAEIGAARSRLQNNHDLAHVALVVDGPARLLEYLCGIASSILVNFLSATVGQWAMGLGSDDNDAMIGTMVIGVSMLWLLGASVGYQ